MRQIVAAVVMAAVVGLVMFTGGGCAKGKKGKAAEARPPARVGAEARRSPRLRPERSPGDRLANAVMKAGGAPRWVMVRVVGFRYVEREGERVVVSRRHVWDVVGGVDTVTTADGVTTTVNVGANPDVNDAAVAAWANDTHWFLAPLRLGADGGAVVEYGGSATVNGKALEVLRVSFENAPASPGGGRYQWYVDPFTSLVMYSDDVSQAGAESADLSARQRVTWEGYRNFGPFRLSTLHRSVGDGRSIAIEDLRVEW